MYTHTHICRIEDLDMNNQDNFSRDLRMDKHLSGMVSD